MKTNITSIIAAVVFTVSFAGSAFASQKETDPSLISRISASGNVTVYVSQGETESIKVDGTYDENSALIATEDGELKIASYTKEPVTLLVTVTSLEEISADGDARIVSTNKLANPLSVSLSDSASAVLDANAGDLHEDISDDATLVLSSEE